MFPLEAPAENVSPCLFQHRGANALLGLWWHHSASVIALPPLPLTLLLPFSKDLVVSWATWMTQIRLPISGSLLAVKALWPDKLTYAQALVIRTRTSLGPQWASPSVRNPSDLPPPPPPAPTPFPPLLFLFWQTLCWGLGTMNPALTELPVRSRWETDIQQEFFGHILSDSPASSGEARRDLSSVI